MGGKKTAGSRAATAQNQFTQQGIDALDPFLQAGTAQLPALTAGATAGGLEERLAEIFGGGGFQSLVDERTRAVQGQLSAGGLTRSGAGVQAAAAVPTDLGFAIENLLSGRQQSLAGQGLGAGGAIATQFGQQGEAAGAGILTDAQARAAGLGQVANLASGIFFSDPRLKTNVEKISEIGDLSVYQWDWIPEAEGTPIWDSLNVGFMADEVEGKYPEHVGEFSGWKAINYPALCNDLRDKFVN